MLNSTALLAPGEEGATAAASDGADRAGSLFGQAEAPDPVRCRGKLGAYYLTKRLVPVKLEQQGRAYILKTGSEATENTANQDKGLITTSDRRRGYCLDFLESMTSEDLIKVTRDKEGYLEEVTSEAQDKSVKIARTVITTIFTAITGAPDFDEYRTGRERQVSPAQPEKPSVLLSANYDPTDPMETALINQRLGQAAGFCLVLEGQPPFSVDDYDCYCEDPVAYIKALAEKSASSRGPAQVVAMSNSKMLAAAHERDAPGIYYRPRRPFSYSVLVKQNRNRPGVCAAAARRDARTRGAWALREEKTIELENVSPIIAIRVDRTFFATRKTSIQFDTAVLYDVKIRKDSELAGFVEIPLQIARSIVAIPGNLVKVRIDNTQSRTRLVAAQMLLVQQQTEYLKLLEQQQKAMPPVAQGGGK